MVSLCWGGGTTLVAYLILCRWQDGLDSGLDECRLLTTWGLSWDVISSHRIRTFKAFK